MTHIRLSQRNGFVLYVLLAGCSSSHGGTSASAGAGRSGEGGAGQPATAAGRAADSGGGGAGSSGSTAGAAGARGAGRGGVGAAGGSGRPDAGNGGGSGEIRACDQASDCGYGEIDHEILKKSDCLCLFGCASLPLNKTTISRRQAQYTALCDPRTNGQGQPCPIDDCIQLPDPSCSNHMCAAGQR